MSTSATTTLARAAGRTLPGALPTPVREKALDILLDTIAVMAAGSDRDEHAALRESMLSGGASGPATVLGRRAPASVGDAVFLNGTLPTVYQLDEGYRVSRGHPGIHVVPVVLAVAEQRSASLDAALAALVAGYEVASRLGTAMGGTKPDIHPHGNWGAVGAAVAGAHLLSDGEIETIGRAIDISSGVAGYPDRRAATAGAGVHHLWASIGAHTGYVAAAAAHAGMTPVAGALESFLLPRSAVAPDPDALVADIGGNGWDRYAILDNYTKFWAACGHTHTAIGAALALVGDRPLTAEEIDRIEITTFRVAASLSEARPANELAARYSMPAVVAAAILDGDFTMDALTDERVRDPSFVALAEKVVVRHDPGYDAGYPQHGRPLAMEVTLRGGESLRRELSYSLGDPELPAVRDDIRGKAVALFTHRFGDARAAGIMSAADALGDAPDLSAFTAALRAAAEPE